MEKMSSLEGLTVYFDTNIFIYALEGFPPLDAVAARLLDFLDEGNCRGVTSELALAECLVKPFERGLEV